MRSEMVHIIIKSRVFAGLFALLFVFLSEAQNVDRAAGRSLRIKSVSFNGKISRNFRYNSSGKIEETQSFYGWEKFYYDSAGRLSKHEIAMHPGFLSSAAPVKESIEKLMTDKTLASTHYDLFEYGENGRVARIKHYAALGTKTFEFRSVTSLTYKGENIVSSVLHDTLGRETQFTNFKYDSRGNVANEEYFYFMNNDSKPTLIRKTLYVCDEKKNPYRIFKDLARPPYDTNTNNIIESRDSYTQDVPGTDKNTRKTTSYRYDPAGWPLEEITDGSKHEIQYE